MLGEVIWTDYTVNNVPGEWYLGINRPPGTEHLNLNFQPGTGRAYFYDAAVIGWDQNGPIIGDADQIPAGADAQALERAGQYWELSPSSFGNWQQTAAPSPTYNTGAPNVTNIQPTLADSVGGAGRVPAWVWLAGAGLVLLSLRG